MREVNAAAYPTAAHAGSRLRSATREWGEETQHETLLLFGPRGGNAIGAQGDAA